MEFDEVALHNKTALAVCTWRDVDIETSRCIRDAYDSGRYHPIYMWNDALVSRARSIMASGFLRKVPSDMMIFVDSDILFSVDDLDKVVALAREKNTVAGGVYAVRRQSETWPAIRALDTSDITFGPNAPPREVKYVSSGFMAIPKHILEEMAKTLPFCRQGSAEKQGFWPFFLPMVVQHENGEFEFLSEDWSFVERVIELGHPIWLECSVNLGHVGNYVYRVTDMADFTPQEEERYILMRDLAEYFKLKNTAELAPYMLKNPAKEKVAAEWRQTAPETAEEVEAFYRGQQDYLWDIAWFNARPLYWQRVKPLMKLTGNVTDFGGGIGSLAIAMHRRSMKMTYVDLPSPQRDFAEWRFAKHNLRIDSVDSLEGISKQDFIVAIDVIEHIHPNKLGGLARQMYDALRPGGQVFAFQVADQLGRTATCGDEPMHFNNGEAWQEAMYEVGFEGGGVRFVKQTIQKELGEPKQVVVKGGMRMFLDPEDTFICRELEDQGTWDEEVAQVIRNSLKPEYTFADLGAHVGYFTLVAAPLCKQVIAVEPHPHMAALLRRSIQANKLDNVVLVEAAVGTETGKTNLVMLQGNTGESYTTPAARDNSVRVMVQTPHTLFEGRWPDVIKIDIEGDEHKVLESCPELLEHCKVLITEVQDRQLRRGSGASAEQYIVMLTDAGFTSTKVIRHPAYTDYVFEKQDGQQEDMS